jgi:transketolase
VAFLRALPGMTVICPGDAVELRLALRAALQEHGPVYIRMGKKGEPVVHVTVPEFHVGKGILLRDGTGICLFSTGTMLPVAVEASNALAANGHSVRLVSMHTVKPLDTDIVADSFNRCKVVVTVEEHSIIGGLGSAVAEWMADAGPQRARLSRIAAPDSFWHTAGDQEHARKTLGLTAQNIAHQATTMLTCTTEAQQ